MWASSERLLRITESQSCRGRQGPLWVTQSNPLPKQGHPEQAAQDLVQEGLEYLQRRRLHNLPGQPVPGLHQSEEVLPRVGFLIRLGVYLLAAERQLKSSRRTAVKLAADNSF